MSKGAELVDNNITLKPLELLGCSERRRKKNKKPSTFVSRKYTWSEVNYLAKVSEVKQTRICKSIKEMQVFYQQYIYID